MGSIKESFELTGHSTYYSPDIYFVIDKMWLEIEPDFQTKTIEGKQQIKLTTKQDLDKIELDCAELDVKSVYLSYAVDIYLDEPQEKRKLEFSQQNDKVIIKINQFLKEGTKFHLLIKYSGKPTRGLNFVRFGEEHATQAWTQGQPTESKYWFPCLDHPQLKYPREISVIVPSNFIIISNGELNLIDQNLVNGKSKKRYVWEESNPNPAYLTCIVIGNFVETSNGENYDGRIPLRYYVPKTREEDSIRTFKNTSKMISFFEKYLSTPYPYAKYSQIVVDDFQYGGMENTTCTTLYSDALYDEIAQLDYSSDDVIAHELAHQWFGDLITCKDWQHIWLNEGFATYCEALYFQFNEADIDFQQYVLEMMDGYLDESNLYTRPIVTNKFRDIDDLFDRHTYNKGGSVLHMLRHYIGDEDFKNSVKVYLDTFKNRTAETDNLRQIFEGVSGKSLEKFFDQWIFSEGHPKLKIMISLPSSNTVQMKILQEQDTHLFEFPLEIKVVTLINGVERSTINQIMISNKEMTKTFEFDPTHQILWVSIDPELKILKDIVSLQAPLELTLQQIENGNTTYEKIQAIRELDNHAFDKRIVNVLKKSIQKDHWSIAREAATVLGTIKDSDNTSHKILIECLFSMTNTRIRLAIVNAIETFRNVDHDFGILKKIIENNNESYFVRNAAANAIGRYDHSLPILKELLERESFLGLISRGALTGLRKIVLRTQDKKLIEEIRDIYVNKSKIGLYFRIRRTAISCLGFLGQRYKDERPVIFQHLRTLLTDPFVHVRNSTCAALGNAFRNSQDSEVIAELEKVIENDSDGNIVRTAIESIKMIKEVEKKEISDKDRESELYLRSKKIEAMENRIIEK
jgi:aminopeptidase N